MKNINHPVATTGLRINCFYDKVLYGEFKRKFEFDYPNVELSDVENERIVNNEKVN